MSMVVSQRRALVQAWRLYSWAFVIWKDLRNNNSRVDPNVSNTTLLKWTLCAVQIMKNVGTCPSLKRLSA